MAVTLSGSLTLITQIRNQAMCREIKQQRMFGDGTGAEL